LFSTPDINTRIFSGSDVNLKLYQGFILSS
jgi:hypothetical protein